MKIAPPKPNQRTAKPIKRKGRARKGDGSLKLRGTTWWYIIPNPVPGGKRIEKSCETSDRNEALRIKNKALLDAGVRRGSSAEPITISEALDDYSIYCARETPRSWPTIRSAIKNLRASFGDILADDLTTPDTDRYRAQRINKRFKKGEHRKPSDSTVNRELAYLRAALRREMRATPPRVTRIPFMNIPSEKDCVREGFITRDDYQVLLKELPASLRPIFVFAFHTGARIGELKKIQWPQINWDKGIVELRPKTTKNSEGRWIPIWGDMREYLDQQKAIRDHDFPTCPWVFFWHDDHHEGSIPGTRLVNFDWSWKRACTSAGYPGLLIHDLRRSAIKFADQEAGISSRLVRLMSGHKTESVYQRYNIAGANDVAKMGRALDEFVNGKPKVVELKEPKRA
jgi:integrase